MNLPECGQRGGKKRGQKLESHNKKIMDGDLSGQNEWPFIVSLVMYMPGGGTGQCGGTLIDRQFVLSAAHCFEHG